jgi:hypothetical protein
MCGEQPVTGAEVWVDGYPYTLVTTNSTGDYLMVNAPIGAHSILASKDGSRTDEQEYDLPEADPVGTANFTNVCPITLDCEADCTILGGDVCMPECSGYTDASGETCSLNSLCVNVKSGLLIEDPLNESRMLKCCEGEHVPVTKNQTRVDLVEDVSVEDVIVTTRIVYYDGKPVKMVILLTE